MVWGAYLQNGDLEEIDQMGSELSKRIKCPVHYPAFDKKLFECKCGCTFMVSHVKAGLLGNWSLVDEIHKNGRG